MCAKAVVSTAGIRAGQAAFTARSFSRHVARLILFGLPRSSVIFWLKRGAEPTASRRVWRGSLKRDARITPKILLRGCHIFARVARITLLRKFPMGAVLMQGLAVITWFNGWTEIPLDQLRWVERALTGLVRRHFQTVHMCSRT